MKAEYLKPEAEVIDFELPARPCEGSPTTRDSEIGGKVGDDDDSEDETLSKHFDVWDDWN